MAWAAVIAGVGVGIGAYTSARAAKRAKNAQKNLENLKTPTAEESPEIQAYYKKASASPYDTAMYKMNQQNIQRGTSQGLALLQDRHSALAGISGLIRRQDDATLRNAAQAQQMQDAKLSDATRLKAGDNQRLFNVNQLMPYDRLSSLYSAQAAGANQVVNAGMQNIYSGLNVGALGLSNRAQNRTGGYNYGGSYVGE